MSRHCIRGCATGAKLFSEALKMQDRKMQDHVGKGRTFEVL